MTEETGRRSSDALTIVGAALIGAVAAIAGGAVTGAYQYYSDKNKNMFEIIRMAAQNNATNQEQQTVKNLLFWKKIGVISIPVESDELRRAACDCLGRNACDQQAEPGMC